MRFQWTDALRLCVLYALGYIAIAALAVAAYRQWGEAEREAVEFSAAAAAIAVGLVVQRNVLSSCIPGGIGFWRWWGAFALGLTIMVATVILIALVWTVAENSGTPLSAWLVDVANPAIDRWFTQLEAPISAPEAWAPAAIFAAILMFVLLLIYWPLASLLKKRTGRTARPYVIAVFITAVMVELASRLAEDLGPQALSGLPEPAFWASLIAAAGTLGILEAVVFSIAFFAMSAPGTPATKPPDTTPPAPKPDTPTP